VNPVASVSPCVPTFPHRDPSSMSHVLDNTSEQWLRTAELFKNTFVGLYFIFWSHSFFPAYDRDPPRAFFLEVYQHAVLCVSSSACFGSFKFWSRSVQTQHNSTVFPSLSAAWRLYSRTDALLGPWRIARLDEIYQSLPPCLHLLLGHRVS
jgi:hypothetical protein